MTATFRSLSAYALHTRSAMPNGESTPTWCGGLLRCIGGKEFKVYYISGHTTTYIEDIKGE